MKRLWCMIAMLLLTLSVSNAQAKTHHVVEGDCLGRLHLRYHVSVKDLQKANHLGESTIIKLGQDLVIPESVKTISENKVVIHTKSVDPRVTYSSPFWNLVNVNPFHGDLSVGLDIMKVDPEVKAGLLYEVMVGHFVWTSAAHTSRGGLVSDYHGNKYQPIMMLSGGGNGRPIDVKTGPDGVINNWARKDNDEPGRLYSFGGVSINIYVRCGNPTLVRLVGEKTSSTESKTYAEEERPTIETEETPHEEVTPAEAVRIFDGDAFVVTGGEFDGRGNIDGFLSFEGAFYPFIIDGENTRDEFGVGTMDSMWGGKNYQGFKWNGGYATIGPAGKHVDYSGWDASIKLLIGIVGENGRDAAGDYRSHRGFGVFGLSFSLNDYERELRGETTFTETQFYGSILFPFSMDAEQSWQGRSISDTRDLRKLNCIMSVGAREFLYNWEFWRLYVQGGFFMEDPTTHSLSFRIGVSDIHKISFAGVGPNANLDHGTLALGADMGVDLLRAWDYERAQHRRTAMIESIQNAPNVKSFDSNTGVLILK